MKILVDEEPYCRSDCPFCEIHYDYGPTYETCKLMSSNDFRDDFCDDYCEVFSENDFDLCPYFKAIEKE